MYLINFAGRSKCCNEGREYSFHGTVLVALADTLAAHQLGGFKVCVRFSLRKCRDCMATIDTMSTKVSYQECSVEMEVQPTMECISTIKWERSV